MAQPDDAELPFSLLLYYATSPYPCSYLPDREALRTAARAYAAGYVAASGIILTASEPGGGSP